MKTLELNQMEELQGGGCDLVGLGISTVGFVIAAATLTAATGGLALVGFLASAASFGYSGADVVLGGECM